jgi:hypothetical protein
MSFEAAVETRYGERLLLWNSDGLAGGKAILAFLNVLLRYCSGDELEDETDSEIKQWFAKIEAFSELSVCKLTKPLQNSFYHGFWNYREDEYSYYLARSRAMQLSEEEFQRQLEFVDSRWVPAEEMLNMLDVFIDLLEQADLEENWWYHPDDTLKDFVMLRDAVRIAGRAGPGTKIRVQFF